MVQGPGEVTSGLRTPPAPFSGGSGVKPERAGLPWAATAPVGGGIPRGLLRPPHTAGL